jgi:hypothetical protein
VRAIGGGSDHESFLFSFGTPVAEFGFGGPFGPYHSSYDTVRYATTQSDPGFVLHRTTAQLYGLLALRFAGADAPPYAFTGDVAVLQEGIDRLKTAAARDGRPIGLEPLQGAVAAFAERAHAADDAITNGAGPGTAAELHAAQAIDALAYGVNGYAAVAFPDVAKAYASRDAAALGAAIERARATIDAAGARITPG